MIEDLEILLPHAVLRVDSMNGKDAVDEQVTIRMNLHMASYRSVHSIWQVLAEQIISALGKAALIASLRITDFHFYAETNRQLAVVCYLPHQGTAQALAHRCCSAAQLGPENLLSGGGRRIGRIEQIEKPDHAMMVLLARRVIVPYQAQTGDQIFAQPVRGVGVVGDVDTPERDDEQRFIKPHAPECAQDLLGRPRLSQEMLNHTEEYGLIARPDLVPKLEAINSRPQLGHTSPSFKRNCARPCRLIQPGSKPREISSYRQRRRVQRQRNLHSEATEDLHHPDRSSLIRRAVCTNFLHRHTNRCGVTIGHLS